MACAELASYLLDDIDAAEKGALEKHLDACPWCRAECHWLATALLNLCTLVSQAEPPPALRQRVLDTLNEARRHHEGSTVSANRSATATETSAASRDEQLAAQLFPVVAGLWRILG